MSTRPAFDAIRSDRHGLVPCIVQDATTHEVLMVGYQDDEAWDKTVDTGLVHFHSRSRGALWFKGETSGNTLSVVSIRLDCDDDAVLINARPAGPTCHTGTTSCFGSSQQVTLGSALDVLVATIDERASAAPSESYTARLLDDGDLVARKTLEEAGELAFAAKDTATGAPDQRVVEEAADLFYHALVLLAQQGVDPKRVASELMSRAR
ncbi:MAG: bifunctional phosphoribosyl-AMP cyclohydrolase/phosphoribosyl-ATP diphosphatase HisIE [Acidimicrobiia bacterium]|nr:MAG: bifunctional phosphoribosyl-AMP cyclohydrolase/phosphoribosyl-ATP diphosphatase HisIE [Acidimicrobiia bacterium]